MRAILVISFILFASCGGASYTSSFMAMSEQEFNAELPPNTYNNTMEEQLEQLEDEDLNLDIASTVYSPVELMSAEEIEARYAEQAVDPVKPDFDHSAWDKLLKKYVSVNGKVNYKGFKSEWERLRAYIDELGQNVPGHKDDKSLVLAYWINAYNALTVDLILRHYPLNSIKDIDQPWKQKNWQLGEKWYDLDEIEHKILRKMDEPRIHFAIVCASFSCPNLLNEAYKAEILEKQLTRATRSFLADPTKNKIAPESIEISKIFQWFSQDFKQNGSLIDFLNRYSQVKIATNAKKRYKDYDWSLNE